MASSLMLTLGPAYNEHWAINGQFSEETRVIAINIKNVRLYTSTAYKKSNRILFLIGNQFFVAAWSILFINTFNQTNDPIEPYQ